MLFSCIQFLAFVLFIKIALASPIPNKQNSNTKQTSTAADTSNIAGQGSKPRTLAPANPPTTEDVSNSITNWGTSVNTVNAFLDAPAFLGAPHALKYARDEPVQLDTLMKVAGLNESGVAAGKSLAVNFPSVPANLESAIKLQQPLVAATTKVNINRCCNVLPAIDMLWQASAAACGMTPPAPVQYEKACALIDCAKAKKAAS